MSRHLQQARLPFAVDFQYLEQGIRIHGQWYPILKMRWVEGLLLNARMVQATFDDLNPDTASRLAYPDTHAWDPERNIREFCAALPTYRQHGLVAVTVNFQGGSPEGYSREQPWENSAFTPMGALRPAYADRMARAIAAADARKRQFTTPSQRPIEAYAAWSYGAKPL